MPFSRPSGIEALSNLHDKSNAELRAIQADSDTVLTSLVEALQMRSDMQEFIQCLMTGDDALETFSQIGVEDPDLARVRLEACVTALANTQCIKTIAAELKHRASRN